MQRNQIKKNENIIILGGKRMSVRLLMIIGITCYQINKVKKYYDDETFTYILCLGSATWNNTIASVLSTHSTIFLSGFEKFKQSGKIGRNHEMK